MDFNPPLCKLGHEAVDFQAVILARVFLLLWLRTRNFPENDQGKDPLINTVITKKSTASCQNLHPIILTSQSILLATILLFFQRDANLQDVEGRSQMWRVFPGIEASSSILQCKIPSFSAKSVRSSVNLPNGPRLMPTSGEKASRQRTWSGVLPVFVSSPRDLCVRRARSFAALRMTGILSKRLYVRYAR